MRAATACFEHFIPLKRGHAEICNFDVAVLVQEQVLWLQVTVANAEPVTVVHAGDAADQSQRDQSTVGR